MVLQNYKKIIEMTANMIYTVALGVGLKCPRKIHLNTQCPHPPSDFQTFLRSCDFFMMSHDASKRDFFNVFIDTKKSATYNYIKANRGCARS